MQNKKLVNVALLLDHDLRKTQFAVKYLAALMAVRPIMVYAMLRSSCNEAGKSVRKMMEKKLEEMKRYLVQAQQTLDAVQSVGKLYVLPYMHSQLASPANGGEWDVVIDVEQLPAEDLTARRAMAHIMKKCEQI